ncbi:hypothetical protein KAU11_08155, partial [Candidatus Babeliales bacterium]|nr:hypothetical protein [Candidatus Babeliales bacterium]
MAGQLRLLSSATAPQGEMIEKSKRAANWAKSFEIFKQVASMGKQVADAEAKNKSKQDAINNMVDSHKAKADAAIFNQAVSNQNGTERRASYEGILGDMTRQFEQGDISQGYYQGYMGSIEGNYDTALGDQQLEYNNAVGESSGSEFMAGVEAGIAGDATVYIDNVNRNTGVPKAVIRDGVLSGVYKNFTTKIDATTNLRELNNTVAAFNDVKVNSLSSTNLLKTRSKELAAKVAQLETNIKGSISAKKKQFKYEAGERVADAIGSVEDPLNQYSKTPSEVDNDISIVNEDNAQAELAAKNTYKTKYDTHQEAKKFVAKNTVFDVVNAGIVKDNEVLKPIWEDSVQNAFMNFYIKGDMNSAIKVSNTQSAFLGEVGDTMYSTFSSTSSPEVLQQFLQADRLYRTTPGGKTAHN